MANKESTIQEFIDFFKECDVNGNGLVSTSDFKDVMSEILKYSTDEEIDKLVKEVNFNNEEYINYEKGIRIIMS